jgi:hypothetical protein
MSIQFFLFKKKVCFDVGCYVSIGSVRDLRHGEKRLAITDHKRVSVMEREASSLIAALKGGTPTRQEEGPSGRKIEL